MPSIFCHKNLRRNTKIRWGVHQFFRQGNYIMIKIKFNEFVKYDIFINYNPFTIKKISLFKLEQGKVRKKKSQTLIWVRKKVRSLFNN